MKSFSLFANHPTVGLCSVCILTASWRNPRISRTLIVQIKTKGKRCASVAIYEYVTLLSVSRWTDPYSGGQYFTSRRFSVSHIRPHFASSCFLVLSLQQVWNEDDPLSCFLSAEDAQCKGHFLIEQRSCNLSCITRSCNEYKASHAGNALCVIRARNWMSFLNFVFRLFV